MAFTMPKSPYDTTPISSCCGAGSQDARGGPDRFCHRCRAPMTHHAAMAQRPVELCSLCGRPRGDVTDPGNCC